MSRSWQRFFRSGMVLFGLAVIAVTVFVVLTSRQRDTVRERRCAQNTQALRHFLDHPLRNVEVGAQREVRSMLLEGTDREHETRVTRENAADVWPGQLNECVCHRV